MHDEKIFKNVVFYFVTFFILLYGFNFMPMCDAQDFNFGFPGTNGLMQPAGRLGGFPQSLQQSQTFSDGHVMKVPQNFGRGFERNMSMGSFQRRRIRPRIITHEAAAPVLTGILPPQFLDRMPVDQASEGSFDGQDMPGGQALNLNPSNEQFQLNPAASPFLMPVLRNEPVIPRASQQRMPDLVPFQQEAGAPIQWVLVPLNQLENDPRLSQKPFHTTGSFQPQAVNFDPVGFEQDSDISQNVAFPPLMQPLRRPISSGHDPTKTRNLLTPAQTVPAGINEGSRLFELQRQHNLFPLAGTANDDRGSFSSKDFATFNQRFRRQGVKI